MARYLPSWDYAPYGWRSHCYMLGLLTGYILHITKTSDIKIPWVVNITIWTVVSGVALGLVYGTYDVDTYSKWKAWGTMNRSLINFIIQAQVQVLRPKFKSKVQSPEERVCAWG